LKSSKQNFVRLLRDALAQQCALPHPTPTVVAVSGGADSMALLEGLMAIDWARDGRIIAAHVNHGLRGSESDADEEFVVRSAGRMGVPVEVRRVDVPGLKRRGESVEMAARRLRHGALASICHQAGIQCLFLAHTADDQVEHFLLRLFRGSGSSGLRGMRSVSPSPVDPSIRLIRPLLSVTRVQVRAFLQLREVRHREDASNLDLSIPRNRVRHELLPMLRRFSGPAVDRMILQSMEILTAEGELAERTATEWLSGTHATPLSIETIAVQRIAIQIQLMQLGVEPEFQLVERLRSSIDQQVSIAGGRSVLKSASGILRLLPRMRKAADATSTCPMKKIRFRGDEGSVHLQEDVRMHWRRIKRPPSQELPPPPEASFDAASLDGELTLRHWMPGDRIRGLGMEGSMKLQDLFVNRKLPKAQRDEVWVGVDSKGSLFWVEGFPPSELHKVRADTRSIIVLRCVRGIVPSGGT
jgi:tRNA(Ile)-lysidine synthase